MPIQSIVPFYRTDVQRRFHTSIDDLINEFFNGFDLSFGNPNKDRTGYPRIDISEVNDKYILDATVPGLTREDIKIEISEKEGKKFLTLRADKEEKKEEKKDSEIIRKEIHRSSFCRNFELPEAIEEDKIVASVKNGILTIDLPKKNNVKSLPKSRAIEIR
jgi:HSP20 family protein